jgi:arsenate reductase (thioredoxin)
MLLMSVTKTILVLCTGNSARSIMAEAYINHTGGNHTGGAGWRAVSAGSKPTGRVNPLALEALSELGIPAPAKVHSKSWDTFAGSGSTMIDLVLTVCDNAAGETCPHFPGPARKVHLPFPDPATAMGSHAEQLAVFRAVFADMRSQLDHLLAGTSERAAI